MKYTCGAWPPYWTARQRTGSYPSILYVVKIVTVFLSFLGNLVLLYLHSQVDVKDVRLLCRSSFWIRHVCTSVACWADPSRKSGDLGGCWSRAEHRGVDISGVGLGSKTWDLAELRRESHARERIAVKVVVMSCLLCPGGLLLLLSCLVLCNWKYQDSFTGWVFTSWSLLSFLESIHAAVMCSVFWIYVFPLHSPVICSLRVHSLFVMNLLAVGR